MKNLKDIKQGLDILKKFRIAPVGEKEIKMNLFNANGRVNYRRTLESKGIIFEDEKYVVEVKGIHLTQIHRDILDIFLYYGDNSLETKIIETKAIRLFTLYEVQKRLNYQIKNNNKWIEKKITEMQQSVFKITSKENGDWIQFSIIDTAKYSKKNNKYAVIINDDYLNFFKNEISIDYKDLLDEIVKLEHPQTKAAVRYLLTFKDGHQINIDKLLRKVGIIEVDKSVFNKVKKRVIEELKKVGKKFNIQLIKTSSDDRKINDYTIKYTRSNLVWIDYETAS
jgi:hypothetical protein